MLLSPCISQMLIIFNPKLFLARIFIKIPLYPAVWTISASERVHDSVTLLQLDLKSIVQLIRTNCSSICLPPTKEFCM